jgi:hypothetical protein
MNQGNSVQVTKADDEWNVTVVEDGKVWTFEFLVEAHALIFAAGQRMRLGLPSEWDKQPLDGRRAGGDNASDKDQAYLGRIGAIARATSL